jgi:CRISPR/Cas system-associated protein Csx1
MYELQQGEVKNEIERKVNQVEMGEKKQIFWVEIRNLTETNWEADEISASLKKENGIEVKF